MKLPSLRNSAAVAVTALLVSGLAACGSDNSDDGAKGGDTSSSSASASTGSGLSGSLGSGSASSGSSVSPGSTIAPADFTSLLKSGVSAVSTAHMTMSMTMSVQGQQAEISADGDLQMSPMAVSMTMSMQGMDIKAVMLDGTMYMQMPGAAAGGKWMKVDLKQLGSMMGGGMSDAFTNPLGMMDQMADYIKEAKYVGTTTVNGTAAKQYQMTVDMDAAMKKLAPNMPSSAAGSMPSTVTENVWLDDQNRPVKIDADMGSMGKMTYQLSDFGKSVHIAAPPASEVTDMPSMPSGGALGG